VLFLDLIRLLYLQELFFRGAILPLVGVDWRGIAVAGLVFGILHITGGRNAAFAAW
jgi:membrane protease YdiL (CAAX protease family)